MAHVKIDRDKCKGCMLCVWVCTRNLIIKSKELNKLGLHTAEFCGQGGKCTGCAVCAVMCPHVCIEVYR